MIKLHDKHLIKQLARKMLNLYYFTDRALRVGINIILVSHHINQSNFKLTFKPSSP